MSKIKCPHCEKTYKTEKGLEQHIKIKHSDVLSVTVEEIIESDVIATLQEEVVLKGLIMTDLETAWIHPWIKGFKYNGQVAPRDINNIVSIYKKNIDSQLSGCLTCPNTLIWLGMCVYKKYIEINENKG
jgi:hypothetical protein